MFVNLPTDTIFANKWGTTAPAAPTPTPGIFYANHFLIIKIMLFGPSDINLFN